jgi:hypothetical protein
VSLHVETSAYSEGHRVAGKHTEKMRQERSEQLRWRSIAGTARHISRLCGGYVGANAERGAAANERYTLYKMSDRAKSLQDRCVLRAVALSYFTLLTIVNFFELL